MTAQRLNMLLVGLCATMYACGGLKATSENNLLNQADNQGGTVPIQAANPNSRPNAGPLTGVSVMAPSAAVLSALGGTVMAAPKVRLLSFDPSDDAASVQNFLIAWSASGAWQEMTQEYGVGPLTVLPLQRATFDWAAQVSDGVISGDANTDIESALIANLDGPLPAWGVADGDTIYVLDMPTGVAVAPTPGAPSACDANTLAWHGAVTLPSSNIVVPYVVVPTCQPVAALTQVDSKTYALSHTLIGAVTDPTGQGFAAIDAAHAVWQLVSQSPEASDLCNQAMYNSSHVLLRRSDMPQALARTWSNVEARLGHSPCLPAIAGEVFFAAAVQAQDAVEISLSDDLTVASATTQGVALGAGESIDVPVYLSSYPTNAGTFNVAVQEVGSSDLTLNLSQYSGSHGQMLSLAIAVDAAPARRQQVVRVTSSQGDISFSQYFLVRQQSAAQG